MRRLEFASLSIYLLGSIYACDQTVRQTTHMVYSNYNCWWCTVICVNI